MGGYGSGRLAWHRAKTTTDGLLKLDVRWLAREGCLSPNATGACGVSWSQGDDPTGDILVRYDAARPSEIVLDYRVRVRDDDPWQPVWDRVALDFTPCRYGGERAWFLCPACLSRRAVLFSVGGRFRCRACHDLAYSSTRESESDRHRRRADELRRRIGCKPGILSAPRKPKGMQWRTYIPIVTEINAREYASLAAFSAESDAWFARFDARFERKRGRVS